MKSFRINNSGITLIALVITIIVLLILAGVSIATLTGNNGILTQANNAKEKTEEAEDIEKIRLAISEAQMGENGYQELDATNFQEALNSQFEGRNIQLSDNGDGSYTISLDNNSKIFYADSNGQIISNENMIEIGTAEELKAFRDDVNSGNSYEGKYVYLTDNITLDSSEEWEPMGYYVQNSENTSIKDSIYNENNKPFSGIFDGQGHTVDYMNINNSKNGQGLFGLVTGGQIKNINLGENCNINMEGIGCGGVVGIVLNTGTIYNCNNYADMKQTKGGVVGTVIGSVTISNCINYGDLNNCNGGIVGTSNGTDWEEFINVQHTIINCANYGGILSSTNYTGGIAGFFKGYIFNSFNIGDINSQKNITGGISGEIYGKIENCYNIADITGVGNVGGITGTLTGNIINCYSIANIAGNYSLGKIYGYTRTGTIENCYSKEDIFNANDLGSVFKEDTNNINNGYPILDWQ